MSSQPPENSGLSSQQAAALSALKSSMDAYYPLQPETWHALQKTCRIRTLEKGSCLYSAGTKPGTFAYVVKGLFRSFITDHKGNEYNKIFFEEGTFPGAMVALLTDSESQFSIEALEPSEIVEIAFQPYRQLLLERHDLALFQVHYLERNWLLSKEPREVALVQEEAAKRY